jgi:PiT family inorganic phosphate transporter
MAGPVFPRQRLQDSGARKSGLAVVMVVLAVGSVYVGRHIVSDLRAVQQNSVFPYVLLGVALVIALGFEFVNGFHDTANAVATVIYTHSLSPNAAVLWSGV